MSADIRYIETLRARAIGFEMIAFYDDMLMKLYDAQFREMIVQDVDVAILRFS